MSNHDSVITLERAQPLLIPHAEQVNIALIGCGGTGSFIAQFFARLAWHIKSEGRRSIQIVFIDGDEFTEDNIGRTLCCPQDVGKNKAQVLAARHNAVWGLDIGAVPEMATTALLTQVGQALCSHATHHQFNILVGAVDLAAGRRAMHGALQVYNGFGQRQLWNLVIDSGNTETAGQVLVGSATKPEQLAGSFALGTACTRLPSPGLMAPGLLEDAPQLGSVTNEDCTVAMLRNRQSLIVNQQQATIVAEYLHAIINTGILSMYATDIVTTPTITVRSKPITLANVAADTGLSEAFLKGKE